MQLPCLSTSHPYDCREIIKAHPTPLERALEMALNGEMVDGHSALALLRCEPYLRKRGD